MAKKRITISISDEILKWIDSQIKDGIFFNRSHAFEYCTKFMKEKKLGILNKQ